MALKNESHTMKCRVCDNTGEQRYLIPGPVTAGPFDGKPPPLKDNIIGTHPCQQCRPEGYAAWLTEQRRITFLMRETNRIP